MYKRPVLYIAAFHRGDGVCGSTLHARLTDSVHRRYWVTHVKSQGWVLCVNTFPRPYSLSVYSRPIAWSSWEYSKLQFIHVEEPLAQCGGIAAATVG